MAPLRLPTDAGVMSQSEFRAMDEELSLKLSDVIIASNRQYSMLIKEMKDKYSPEVYAIYLEKIAHIMALSFDMLDEIGKSYPHLNPSGENGEH